MPRKRHTPEQIIGKLREAEVGLASGQTVPEVCRTLGIAEQLVAELLDGEIYYSLKEAQVLIERWRHHYNTVRPHSALGYKPPAPQTIVPKRTDPAFAIDGLQPDQPFPETVPGLT